MEGSEIPKVASEHLGPQPLPEISHCDCAGVGNFFENDAFKEKIYYRL